MTCHHVFKNPLVVWTRNNTCFQFIGLWRLFPGKLCERSPEIRDRVDCQATRRSSLSKPDRSFGLSSKIPDPSHDCWLVPRTESRSQRNLCDLPSRRRLERLDSRLGRSFPNENHFALRSGWGRCRRFDQYRIFGLNVLD